MHGLICDEFMQRPNTLSPLQGDFMTQETVLPFEMTSTLRHALDSLDSDIITSPQVPPETLLSYGDDVINVLQGHDSARLELAAVGLEGDYFDTLEQLLALAHDVEAIWVKRRHEGISEELIALELQGTRVRHELVTACRFYLRRDATTQRDLQAIMYGEGLSDLILDLNSVGRLIRSNRRAFKHGDAFNVDEHLSALKILINRLRQARVGVRSPKDVDQTRMLRDRVFSLLHLRLIEVCAAGQHCFYAEDTLRILFEKAQPPQWFSESL